jgi:hypothetical protein
MHRVSRSRIKAFKKRWKIRRRILRKVPRSHLHANNKHLVEKWFTSLAEVAEMLGVKQKGGDFLPEHRFRILNIDEKGTVSRKSKVRN